MTNKYEVGYGKSPEKYQFKQGKSGNPKGRPKGSKNTYTLLQEALSKKIEVQENGKAIKISKKAAMLTQLVNKAVKGEVKAISALLPHMLAADISEEEKNKMVEVLNSNDQVIIDSYFTNYKEEKSE